MSVKSWFPAVVFLVGVLCWGTAWRIILQSKTVLGISTDVSPSQIISLTNLKREEAGLMPLQPDPALTAAAQDKLDDMAARAYFAHLDPDGIGSWQFIDNHGYRYYYAGENLAKNFNSSIDVVNAWMSSPDHRNNLLSPNYTNIGVAVVQSGNSRYIVQLLATPLPQNLTGLSAKDRPFSFSVQLVGRDFWSDNYFLSSLIMSLAIVIFGGLLALPIGKRLAKAGTARLTIWRKKQS